MDRGKTRGLTSACGGPCASSARHAVHRSLSSGSYSHRSVLEGFGKRHDAIASARAFARASRCRTRSDGFR
ncbi:hypothetical protein PsYK624_171230 [Phanerochaete sordida]|uniref:Uncharacterized protein n=1 Tax=Phanerochaete sordida TaxID=48140 RepID=A0A9P3GS14_9APHY|nr:hypothetical protein PsYK624_171230 [Phanerochaete sordida]